MKTTIKTLRALADRIHGKGNYTIESKYTESKAERGGKKIYSINGQEFRRVQEVCKRLEIVCKTLSK